MSLSSRCSFAMHFPGVEPRWAWVRWFSSLIDFLSLPFEKDHIKNAFDPTELNTGELWKWYKIKDQKKFDRAIATIETSQNAVIKMAEGMK